MKILTNDPSMTAWGWAIVAVSGQTVRVLDSGCIKTEPEHKKRHTRASDDMVRRLDDIARTLDEVCQTHQPDWVVSELPHGSQNASAAKMIGAVAGVISCFTTLKRLPIEWYSEQDAKKYLTGKRSVTKTETLDAIKGLYGDRWLTGTRYKDEAVADALAVFHVARHTSQSIRHAMK